MQSGTIASVIFRLVRGSPGGSGPWPAASAHFRGSYCRPLKDDVSLLCRVMHFSRDSYSTESGRILFLRVPILRSNDDCPHMQAGPNARCLETAKRNARL